MKPAEDFLFGSPEKTIEFGLHFNGSTAASTAVEAIRYSIFDLQCVLGVLPLYTTKVMFRLWNPMEIYLCIFQQQKDKIDSHLLKFKRTMLHLSWGSQILATDTTSLFWYHYTFAVHKKNPISNINSTIAQ